MSSPAPEGPPTGARADWLSTALVVFMAGAFAYPLCVRGINLSDEGFLLQEVVDILAGKVLYRDIEAFVAPGMWYLTAALFTLVEPSVLSSRILAWLAYVGTVGVSFHLAIRHCGFPYALGVVLAFLTLSLWAYPSWTFAWYSPWAVMFALLALDQVMRWDEGGARGRGHLLAAGVFVGLTVVFKQNYGAFSLAATAVAIAATRHARGDRGLAWLRATWAGGLPVAAGLCAVVFPVLAYFASEGALGTIFYRFVVYPTEFTGTAHIPFPDFASLFRADLVTDGDWRFTYMAPHAAMAVSVPLRWFFDIQGVERLYILGYFIPPAVFLAGTVLGLRGRGGRIDAPLLAVCALAALVFLGVFPRADFTHLITVYPPAMLAAAFLAHRLTRGGSVWRRVGARIVWSVGGLLAVVYVFYAGVWYLHLIESESRELRYPRAGVLVSPLQEHTLREQLDAIVARVGPGEPMLTVPDMAMLNFLAERPQAGPYYQMYDHMISHDEGRGVVEAAEAHGVQTVLVRRDNFFSAQRNLTEYAPVLASWLRTHFAQVHTINSDRLIFLQRRESPLPADVSRDLIVLCELSPPRTRRMEHLYFDSLFQGLDETLGRERETRCPLPVGGPSHLRVRTSYRRPLEASREARVEVEARLESPDGDRVLARETLRVEPEQMGGHPPDPVFEIDLDETGAGATVVLRSRLRGDVEMHPLDVTPFGVMWQDPRLQRLP